MSITCLTPTYNTDWSIQTTLNCLLEQDFQPGKEINAVFIDNGSQDNTVATLESYRARFEAKFGHFTIKEVGRHPDPKAGKIQNIVWSLQQGLELSKPDDICFIASDVKYPPHSLSRLKAIHIRVGADIAAGLTLVVAGQTSEKGNVTWIHVPQLTAYYFHMGRQLFNPIGHHNWDNPKCRRLYKEAVDKIIQCDAVGTGLCLVKRVVLDKVHMEHSTRYGEDLWFCYRAKEAGFKIHCDTSLWYDHLHYKYTVQRLPNGDINFILAGSRYNEPILMRKVRNRV